MIIIHNKIEKKIEMWSSKQWNWSRCKSPNYPGELKYDISFL